MVKKKDDKTAFGGIRIVLEGCGDAEDLHFDHKFNNAYSLDAKVALRVGEKHLANLGRDIISVGKTRQAWLV